MIIVVNRHLEQQRQQQQQQQSKRLTWFQNNLSSHMHSIIQNPTAKRKANLTARVPSRGTIDKLLLTLWWPYLRTSQFPQTRSTLRLIYTHRGLSYKCFITNRFRSSADSHPDSCATFVNNLITWILISLLFYFKK